MKTTFITCFFLGHIVLGFSQFDFDPFNLPPSTIKEGRIKSITEYDSDQQKKQFAIYDTTGNEIYFQSDNRIIKNDLVYNENGEIHNEQVSGLEHSTLLEKRVLYSKSEKRIVAIYYTLPIEMITTGFIEKYTYNDLGFVEQIEVFTLDKNKLLFLHKYNYNIAKTLDIINSYVIDSNKDTLKIFSKKFEYTSDGQLKSMLQTTENGDTIVSLNYNNDGLIDQEIISSYYVTPHRYLYSSEIYFDFLEDADTPLNTYILMHNIYQENPRMEVPLIYLFHTYDQRKLVSTLKKVDHTKILETVQYVYNADAQLTQQIKVNYRGDTTVYEYTNKLLKDGSIESIVKMSQHSNASLTLTTNSAHNGDLPEIKIELLKQSWNCKTSSEYSKSTNSVIRKQFCMDLSNGSYDSIPNKTIIATFDQNGRQIRSETIEDFDDFKVSQSILWYYGSTGLLEKYEILEGSNTQYWKYQYDSINFNVLKLELFQDSLYTLPVGFYEYVYDSLGNYSVSQYHVDGENGNRKSGLIEYYNSAGKLIKQLSWPSSSIGEDPESFGPIHSVMYIYNAQGFCVEIISEEQDIKEIKRYEYEYH